MMRSTRYCDMFGGQVRAAYEDGDRTAVICQGHRGLTRRVSAADDHRRLSRTHPVINAGWRVENIISAEPVDAVGHDLAVAGAGGNDDAERRDVIASRPVA